MGHFDPRVVCAEPDLLSHLFRFTFPIDDFEDAFEDLVVEDEITACACCCMPGTGRRSGGRAPRQGPPRAMARRGATAGPEQEGVVVLRVRPFSHLRGATSKQGRGAGFLGMSTSSQAQPEQPEKLVMRPGGKGHAEVAVTLLNRTTVVQPEEPKAEEKVSPTRSVNLSRNLVRGGIALLTPSLAIPRAGRRERASEGVLAAAVQGNISPAHPRREGVRRRKPGHPPHQVLPDER